MIIDANTRIGKDVSRYVSKEHGPEDQISLMDSCRIDKAIVIPYSYPPGTSEGYKKSNDYAAQVAKQYPRLIPFAQLDPRDPEASRELRRAFDIGHKGVRIFSWHAGPVADSSYVFPVVETAADLGIPVMFYSNWHDKFAHPYRIVRVARLCPKATIIMEGMGGSDPDMPWFLSDLAEMAGNPSNLILDTSCSSEMVKYLYEYLCEDFGSENIVFGSGSPLFHPKLAIKKLELAGITEQQKTLILGENMARILKID